MKNPKTPQKITPVLFEPKQRPMDEGHVIAKTLLWSWHMIDEVCRGYAELITFHATHSYEFMESTELIFDRLSKRIDKKEQLQEIKNRIKEFVNKMPGKKSQILEFYFFDCISIGKIAKKFDLTTRTIERIIADGIDSLAKGVRLWMDKPTFVKLLKENPLIARLCDRILAGEPFQPTREQ